MVTNCSVQEALHGRCSETHLNEYRQMNRLLICMNGIVSEIHKDSQSILSESPRAVF